MKDVVMIGGPNGAGKTTWAYRRLASMLEIREFVNADEIARGISPLDPEASALAAGRMMIDRLNELMSDDNSDESGILIAERPANAPLLIHDNDRWNRIEGATR